MALGTEIALIKALGGGSGSLPPITASDNGKVLTAKSGVWVAANPSAGGGVLVVTDTDGTLDKTWQEIHDASFAILVNESDEYSKDCAMFSYMNREGRDEPYSYNVTFGDDATYTASSASGYPTLVV